jgi:hypothetical protein
MPRDERHAARMHMQYDEYEEYQIRVSTKCSPEHELRARIRLSRKEHGEKDPGPTGREIFRRFFLKPRFDPKYHDEMAIELARRWYKDCFAVQRQPIDFHVKCYDERTTFANGASEFLPSRLMDVRGNVESIKLVIRDDVRIKNHRHSWVALSYCWGKSTQANRTTSENMAEKCRGIKIEELPKTIRDAVALCRGLEIPFLWVDSICILQDIKDDFIREAGQMNLIYGGAAFTLAVCESSDSDHGFLGCYESERLTDRKFFIANLRIKPKEKTLEEEEILSPRILYWSTHGLFWTCNHSNSVRSHQPNIFWRDFAMHNDAQTNWEAMVEAYSRRNFTHHGDRLPALSGLARLLDQGRYLAGHWRKSLPEGLLWATTDVGHSSLKFTDKITVGTGPPTWSWASLPPARPVKFSRSGSTSCKILSDYVKTTNNNKFGIVMHASLCIQGALRPLLQSTNTTEWPRLFPGNTSIPKLHVTEPQSNVYAVKAETRQILFWYDSLKPIFIKADYDIPEYLNQCYCLEISDRAFLLLRKAEYNQIEGFVRIGCAQEHDEANFFNNAEVRKLTLF